MSLSLLEILKIISVMMVHFKITKYLSLEIPKMMICQFSFIVKITYVTLLYDF